MNFAYEEGVVGVKSRKVQEVINSLDTRSTNRLYHFSKRLSTSREHVLFDDKIEDILKKYVIDLHDFELTVNYLEEIKFTKANYDYGQIRDQLHNFQKENHPYFGWNRNYQKAKETLISEMKAFRPISLQYKVNSDIVDAIPRLDTHAGWEYILTGKKLKGEYVDTLLEDLLLVEKIARREGSFNKPILPGSRGQASGQFDENEEFTHTFKSKTRLISMIDLMVILCEMRWAKPIQYNLANTMWYAGGKNDAWLTGVLQSTRWKLGHWISLDYSKFDQSISDWLIYDAFDIMKQAFYCDNLFDEELFSIITKDLINKTFIDGEGKLISSKKGVPSGSMFTQIVDSIVNRLMVLTYLNSKSETNFQMFIMGDDNLIFSENAIDKEDIASYIFRNFGVQVNAEKSKQGTNKNNPEFLSREWTADGAYRPSRTLISKILYPERFRDYRLEDGPDPYLIIYSYILAFRCGMNKLIDVESFMVDNLPKLKKFSESDLKHASGLLRYQTLYA